MGRAHSGSRDIVSIATLPQGASVTRRRSQKTLLEMPFSKAKCPAFGRALGA
jgi:hypothetical protein